MTTARETRLHYDPATDTEIANYRAGILDGVMVTATVNVVGSLITRIDQAMARAERAESTLTAADQELAERLIAAEAELARVRVLAEHDSLCIVEEHGGACMEPRSVCQTHFATAQARATAAEQNADFLRESIGECHMMLSRSSQGVAYHLRQDWDSTTLPARQRIVMQKVEHLRERAERAEELAERLIAAEAQVAALTHAAEQARTLHHAQWTQIYALLGWPAEASVSAAQVVARIQELEAQVIRKAIWIVAQQPFYPDTQTGTRQQWVKDQIVSTLSALLAPAPPAAEGA